MKTTEKPFKENQSTELAIGSFIVSTILFVLYIVSNGSSNVLIIAFPFVTAAILANTIMLFHLIDKFIELTEQRKDIAVKILILLSNIPVTMLYYSIVMKL
jgi:hypothetical protein